MKKALLTAFLILFACNLIYAQEIKSGSSNELKIDSDSGQNGELDRDRLREKDIEGSDALKEQNRDRIRLQIREKIKECQELNKEIKNMVRERTRSGEMKMQKTSAGKKR
ncbi:MAG: hypothetical protein JW982_07675 [Spirochaetes bacterium]|nr:hypothetical protein [Spirochaetota bacterium]